MVVSYVCGGRACLPLSGLVSCWMHPLSFSRQILAIYSCLRVNLSSCASLSSRPSVSLSDILSLQTSERASVRLNSDVSAGVVVWLGCKACKMFAQSLNSLVVLQASNRSSPNRYGTTSNSLSPFRCIEVFVARVGSFYFLLSIKECIGTSNRPQMPLHQTTFVRPLL